MAISELPQLGSVSADRAVLGSKAATLSELTAEGFKVPAGFVVTSEVVGQLGNSLAGALKVAAARIGPGPYAVRSSSTAEDLAGASYAGLYETLLNVELNDLEHSVRHCLASSGEQRVAAYEAARGAAVRGDAASPTMAVLVQQMVQPQAAGVAFTANPLTGDSDQTIVTAVAGLGESLVSGEAIGEQWTVNGSETTCNRGGSILTSDQARQVAALARRLHERAGVPQDIEWALDQDGALFLLQARPMTALPTPVVWTAPGEGLWARNFRLGEWLPDPMTPLFEDWLLPRIEAGYLDGMEDDIQVRVPFRYGSVNGWYYNAPPIPSPRIVAPLIVRSRGRLPWFLFNVLLRVSRNPAAAHRAVLHGLEMKWRHQLLPDYRDLVRSAEQEVDAASPARLIELVDGVVRQAGIYLWSLAVVGGSAWKMEAALARFWQKHLAGPLSDTPAGRLGHQALLRGLTGSKGSTATPSESAVYSLDWYHRTFGEAGIRRQEADSSAGGQEGLDAQRKAAEAAAREVLLDAPGVLTRFDSLVTMAQYYAALREEQSLYLTLGWPVLRRCAKRLGENLAAAGAIQDPQDVHFLHLNEVLNGSANYRERVGTRRTAWQMQRRLDAPLIIGQPGRFGGDPIASAVDAARTTHELPAGAIVGHPASTGRATGTVRVMSGLDEFDSFLEGEILVARSTAPAWTPLFARAAAVVTDGGTLAAHASLIAREYGIPAVVGTGNATRQLRTGQRVTVDGGAGYVVPAE
ncbi:PEP/pyruvate-binding domain-containing protein [Arthrobacter sp. StoSoilB5]|uniref:PEP/pyruvate-binding domain-containing protein n=1 Tax=Arthrobacter sp. StoSoilB5 TaxID=2830992 RepID=UPI001CC65BDD|nr:PEP/pyruvate-binding domain-containing protein [Arthrobacter sp. StoSoilB5]BCW47103.1 pyruvate, phosphate dikinase [Arthrobacter sp. StoSoilB5]